MGKRMKAVNIAAMNALAQRFGTFPPFLEKTFSAKDFLVPIDEPGASRELRQILIVLCTIANRNFPSDIGALKAQLAMEHPVDTDMRDLYAVYEKRHAYVGTLVVGILHDIRMLHGVSRWALFRQHSRQNWRGTILHELVENLGKPTVPSHLVPVFALHQVERRQLGPITSLSVEQMELLGL